MVLHTKYDSNILFQEIYLFLFFNPSIELFTFKNMFNFFFKIFFRITLMNFQQCLCFEYFFEYYFLQYLFTGLMDLLRILHH